MDVKTRRTMKKYGGNITAAFGADLWTSGVTGIPNLLLKFYRAMDICDAEMMLLIQMLRLRSEEKDLYPTAETLVQCLAGDTQTVQSTLDSLLKKEMLTEIPYYDEVKDEVLTGYDFEPLFEKLSDIWACARVKEIEKTRRVLEGRINKKNNVGALYQSFEKEFGRPLSPIEVEKISQWSDTMGPAIVQEALRRAVLMGYRNFRYIDSIILEWEKNNLRTPEDINEYEKRFKERRAKGRRTKDASGQHDEKTKTGSKKELIKQLYMS